MTIMMSDAPGWVRSIFNQSKFFRNKLVRAFLPYVNSVDDQPNSSHVILKSRDPTLKLGLGLGLGLVTSG